MMTCVCDGQCGRHTGVWLEKRSDGRVWCGICWTAEQKRRAAERREAKAEIAEAEERQEKLF